MSSDNELKQELSRLRLENASLKRLLVSDVATAPGSPTNATSNAVEGLTIIVVGASGDLAKKKTYPAIFSLYVAGLLPQRLSIVGFARSKLGIEEFRARLQEKLPAPNEKHDEFLQHCSYFAGFYDSETSFAELNTFVSDIEDKRISSVNNRLFYYAIPPEIFLAVTKSVKASGTTSTGWNRLVVEKPFGHDTVSAAKLGRQLLTYFKEEQVFRIDHYLGKEMVQNLMTLRFANSIFEPLWNSKNIDLVTITFKEDIGTQGRGGYFDKSGIIRDVMQNHLTQILSLVAMEHPISSHSEDIRDEKVKVLRCIEPVTMDRIVVGQYVADKEGKNEGYLDDSGVPDDSKTPTYAMAVLFIKNQRWEGVPFILKCGKALDQRKAEVRVQFKPPAGSMYENEITPPNELVLRVQPNEAIYFKFLAKKPGLNESLHVTDLDLTYHERFGAQRLPDAYERLILDVIRGDRNLFVRNDELLAAWSIFTPILHHLQNNLVDPIPYEFGSRGPKKADLLAASMGFKRTPDYQWQQKASL